MIASFLEDAAHFPGGFAAGVATPTSEAEIAALVRAAASMLPIGAQSSLTGGATPRGEVVLSTSRLNRILASGDDWIRVEAGVTLVDLDLALAKIGKHYPPAPTFTGAFAGGVVATNAAGAATFKYGTTREWVSALTIVLRTATSSTSSADRRLRIPTDTSRSFSPIESLGCLCRDTGCRTCPRPRPDISPRRAWI